MIAAAEGLTQASGTDISQLQPWAQNLATISKGRTIGIHMGALGIAYNSEIMAEKGVAPACWKDLAKPEYAGEIQVANPNSSGTALYGIGNHHPAVWPRLGHESTGGHW